MANENCYCRGLGCIYCTEDTSGLGGCGDFDPEDVKRLMESQVDWKAQRLCEYFGVPMPMSSEDIELTCRALKACGYRVHLKERNGSQWVTAVKGLGVRYEHWHPLTNINQAMQLLIDAPQPLNVRTWYDMAVCCIGDDWIEGGAIDGIPITPAALINAQCRAIVTACASLEVVR